MSQHTSTAGRRRGGRGTFSTTCSICIIAGVAVGCGNGDPPAAGPDAGGPAALYESPVIYPDAELVSLDVVVSDPTRGRNLNVRIRAARGVPQPAPLVMIVHGGLGGNTFGHASLAGWGEELARRGYVAVNVGHRPSEPLDGHCAPLGIPLAECDQPSDFSVDGPPAGTMHPLMYDRVLDLRVILDELPELEARTGGRVDRTRMAVLGHSAGSHAALMTRGLEADFSASVHDVQLLEPRFRAVVALSPQGPGVQGLSETSWQPITVPVMIQTGRNDTTNGQEVANRRLAFDHLAGPDVYENYIDAAEANHEFFSLQARADTDAERYLLAAAVAFLDAHVRDDAAAAAWLGSDELAEVSAGASTLRRK